MTINYGASGPNLRGAGRKWDLRKDEPYSIYDQFDFEIPIGEEIPSRGIVLGDCWNRYMVRMDEMKESVKILRQLINKEWPEGPIMASMKAIRPPEGEIYSRSETPRGELGFYIISDGSAKPVRVKVKSPCFAALSALSELSRGLMLADIIAIIGSIDIVMGEADR